MCQSDRGSPVGRVRFFKEIQTITQAPPFDARQGLWHFAELHDSYNDDRGGPWARPHS
jgi:hypothetical protein